MHRLAMQLGRELDTANEFYSASLGDLDGFIKSSKGIVVGNAEDPDAGADGFLNQLSRRTGAV
jgi:hypothetical protein